MRNCKNRDYIVWGLVSGRALRMGRIRTRCYNQAFAQGATATPMCVIGGRVADPHTRKRVSQE